jgi:hypothetical protein
MRQLIGILIAVAVGIVAQDASGEIRASARSDKQRVVVGEAFIYEIRLDGVRSAEAPELGEIAGARVDFIGGSDSSVSSVMIVNGRRRETSRESYVMQWRVTPTREGTIRMPVQTVDAGGRTVQAGSVIVRVGAAQQTGDMTLNLRAGKKKARRLRW